MKFLAYIIIFVGLTFTTVFALNTISQNTQTQPSYDTIPITSKTWQEVDLSYSDIIKGKEYPAEIKLLRPIEWLKKHGMNEVGNKVKFSIPEFGVVDVVATVKAIKPTNLDTSKVNWSKKDSEPVIGTFKRYASDVRTYTFKDEHGNIEQINATPNHPFFVKNKNMFVAIKDVGRTDEFISQSGKQIRLICLKEKINHCGEQYNKNGKPVAVYNMEVYQQHIYYVGKGKILIHNICNADRETLLERAKNVGSSGNKNIFWGSYETIPEPEVVMRGANERPEQAFEEGLMPSNYSEGVNDDLIDHHLGDNPTQWVSTTRSEDFANGFAESRGWKYYIYMDPEYTVDLEENYHRLNREFYPEYYSDGSESDSSRSSINSGYSNEEELSHLGRIPRENIIGASPYGHDDVFIPNLYFNKSLSGIKGVPSWLK